MQSRYCSVVSLDDLLVQMNIGVGEEERSEKQDIKMSFKLFYQNMPKACETDNIEDTNCYHEIYKVTHDYCSKNTLKLLEFLCFQVHRKIREITAKDIKIWVRAEKCKPPIDNFSGTTSFEYSDV
jgi:dihydroneopterin aldolase